MSRVFNTAFEASLRLVLLLSVIDEPIEFERMVALDTITIYGKSLNLAYIDLHNNLERRTEEYSARRYHDKNAINRLVLTSYVKARVYDDSIVFSLTEVGREYSDSLSSEYACDYRKNAMQVYKSTKEMSTDDMISTARDTRR